MADVQLYLYEADRNRAEATRLAGETAKSTQSSFDYSARLMWLMQCYRTRNQTAKAGRPDPVTWRILEQ